VLHWLENEDGPGGGQLFGENSALVKLSQSDASHLMGLGSLRNADTI
jgi:hypothetical protein